MIIEIIPAGGIGQVAPIVLSAAQIVVRQENGTPIAVAVTYGPDGAVSVGSIYHDASEFHRMLRTLGINETVIVDRLRMAGPPPGAVLLAGPK